jgi:hypothetical protein
MATTAPVVAYDLAGARSSDDHLIELEHLLRSAGVKVGMEVAWISELPDGEPVHSFLPSSCRTV